MEEKRFFNLSIIFQVIGGIALASVVTYSHFSGVVFVDNDLVAFFKCGVYFLIEVVVARLLAKKFCRCVGL